MVHIVVTDLIFRISIDTGIFSVSNFCFRYFRITDIVFVSEVIDSDSISGKNMKTETVLAFSDCFHP